MHYIEYGSTEKEAVILLHGGGLSWWNYREAAKALSSDYHVILPILDGHAGSSHGFSSIEENAARIIAFIDERLGGSVLMIGGLSLGAQVLLDMLCQRSGICRYALIESALVLPSRLTHAMIAPAFGSCYGLIRRKWFSKLQFQSYHLRQELFDDYYRDTCAISKADMIAFLQANALYALKPSLKTSSAAAHVFVGAKENRAMRKSAAMIHQALPSGCLCVLPGLRHGAFSINRPQDYADAVRRILQA